MLKRLSAIAMAPSRVAMVVVTLAGIFAMRTAAMAARGVVRHPFPDVAPAAVMSHDFVVGEDGLAAGRVADEASVVTVVVGAGCGGRHQRESAEHGKKGHQFFHGGV